MFDLLNNREFSIVIWFVITLILLMLRPSTRKAIFDVLKAAFAKKLVQLYLWMVIYLISLVFLLNKISLWDVSQIKNTVVWLLFTGFPTVLNASKAGEDKNYFKDAIKDVFRFTTITEFIAGLYSFSLIAELIFIPFIVLIGGMLAVSKREKKYWPVTKLLNSLLAILGVFLICFTVYKLIGNFQAFTTTGTLSDFLIPPVLTLLFLPFILLVSIYMTYETNFVTIKFALRDPKLEKFARRQALLHFRLRTEDLKRWKDTLLRRERKTKEDIIASIQEVKDMKKVEKNPPTIPANLGWSPYLAKDFLLSDGIETGYYKRLYENEWSAISEYIKLKDDILANNISYYVIGDNEKVMLLEINLNVHTPKEKTDAHAKLLTCAQNLYLSALNKEMPPDMAEAILQGQKKTIIEGKIKISLSRQEWPQHVHKGYGLKFFIGINPENSNEFTS